MAELPEVENRAWQASTWAPIALVAVFVVFTFVINPTGMSEEEAPLGLAAFGLMLSAPLACALFAAWAPQPTLWRFPLAAAASGLLGLTGCVPDGELSLAVVYTILFAVAWFVLALLRRWPGWRLSLNAEQDGAYFERTVQRQFSVKYLLAWTSVASILLFLAKYIAAERYHNHSRQEEIWAAIWSIIGFTAIMSIGLAPVITVTGVILSGGRISISRVVIVLLSLVAATLLANIALRWYEPPSPSEGFFETWWFLAQLCLGATFGMLLSTGTLRWAGYRIFRRSGHA